MVTATDAASAASLAREIAEAGWARRAQFRPSLTALEDAVVVAKGTEDPSLHALAFADVADNPGGGTAGEATLVLKELIARGATGVAIGTL